MQSSNNALLPPMDWDDFKNTKIFRLLEDHEEISKMVCGYLSTDNMNELEYVPNPRYTGYTPYEQDDFDEISNFIHYNGTEIKRYQILGFSFRLVDTSAGEFLLCYCGRYLQGILNRK